MGHKKILNRSQDCMVCSNLHANSKHFSMDKLFSITAEGALLVFLCTLGIYLSVIVLTRICGNRSFSKMSSFDFAMTVGVGSILATTILSSTVSLLEGMIGLSSIYLLQITVAYARRNKTIHNLVDNSPLLLMDGEKILMENLRKARLSEGDLRSKLRQANISEMSQVKAVVFETTGDISVLHAKKESGLDLWLMSDVNRD